MERSDKKEEKTTTPEEKGREQQDHHKATSSSQSSRSLSPSPSPSPTKQPPKTAATATKDKDKEEGEQEEQEEGETTSREEAHKDKKNKHGHSRSASHASHQSDDDDDPEESTKSQSRSRTSHHHHHHKSPSHHHHHDHDHDHDQEHHHHHHGHSHSRKRSHSRSSSGSSSSPSPNSRSRSRSRSPPVTVGFGGGRGPSFYPRRGPFFPGRRPFYSDSSRLASTDVASGNFHGNGSSSAITPEEQAKEAEREARTVFIQNFPIDATDNELKEFLEKAGPVLDLKMITDKFTRKSKGFGYVEYADRDSIPKAVALTGYVFKSHVVKVTETRSEKNKGSAANAAKPTSLPTKVQVRNLPPQLDQGDVQTLFVNFGEIEKIEMTKETDGTMTALILYTKSDDARKAIRNANGQELAGNKIALSMIIDPLPATILPSAQSPQSPLPPPQSLPQPQQLPPIPPPMPQGPDLDDLDGRGGLVLTAQSRAQLMANLQHSGNSTQSLLPPPTKVPMTMIPTKLPSGITLSIPAPALPMPLLSSIPLSLPPVTTSRCVLLKNMFDPAKETDPNFDVDLRQQVVPEVERKAGPLLHVYIDKMSNGFIYLKFHDIPSAQQALTVFNGRYFAGTAIVAEPVPECM